MGKKMARLSRGEEKITLVPTEKGQREAKLKMGKAAAKELINATMKKNQNTDSNN
jgi:hypothetical protein